MARNGSGTFVTTDGTYTGPNVHAQQKAAAVKITASRMDATIEDIAAGLTQSISKDGQTTITADLPMGGFKFTGLAAGSANGNSVRYEQLVAVSDAIAPAISAAINPAGAALTLGPSTANDIQFQSGGAGRFKWDDSDVSLEPNTSLVYDVGTVTALWRAVYTALVHSGANELILSSGASGGISFRVSTFVCWRLNEFTGGLDQNATNGGNITFAKANTGIVETVAATVSAAGTVIGDATQLAATINYISTVGANTGVKLPDLTVGMKCVVMNAGANTLKLYPPSGSQGLGEGALGAAISIASGSGIVGYVCYRITSTKWMILPQST